MMKMWRDDRDGDDDGDDNDDNPANKAKRQVYVALLSSCLLNRNSVVNLVFPPF